MAFPDHPESPEPAQAPDNQPLNDETLLAQLYEAGNAVVTDDSTQSGEAARKQRNAIAEQGQVASMDLPEGWTEAAAEHSKFGIGSRSMREFHPDGNSEVKLGFFYRGLKISSEGGQAFRSLLQSSPHQLSTEEIATIRETLQEAANPEYFSLQSAKTEQWNGKQVLIVRGVYKKSQNEIYDIFVDTDGTGQSIQEIFYQAPKDQYLRFLNNAKSAMKSIIWR